MHLLTERFFFLGWRLGFSERGSQDSSHGTNVASQLVNVSVFTSIVYGSGSLTSFGSRCFRTCNKRKIVSRISDLCFWRAYTFFNHVHRVLPWTGWDTTAQFQIFNNPSPRSVQYPFQVLWWSIRCRPRAVLLPTWRNHRLCIILAARRGRPGRPRSEPCRYALKTHELFHYSCSCNHVCRFCWTYVGRLCFWTYVDRPYFLSFRSEVIGVRDRHTRLQRHEHWNVGEACRIVPSVARDSRCVREDLQRRRWLLASLCDGQLRPRASRGTFPNLILHYGHDDDTLSLLQIT